jgi:hypothetical protein
MVNSVERRLWCFNWKAQPQSMNTASFIFKGPLPIYLENANYLIEQQLMEMHDM